MWVILATNLLAVITPAATTPQVITLAVITLAVKTTVKTALAMNQAIMVRETTLDKASTRICPHRLFQSLIHGLRQFLPPMQLTHSVRTLK